MEPRRCKRCGQDKPLEQFEVIASGRKPVPEREYRRHVCRSCHAEDRAIRKTRCPDAFIRSAVHQLKYARRKEGIEFTATPDEVIRIYYEQKGLCALTGLTLTYERTGRSGPVRWLDNPFNLTIDRIDPAGVYAPRNIMLTCKLVNYARGVMPMSDFIELCQLVVDNTGGTTPPLQRQ